MKWLAFSHSLPSQAASVRVSVWRKLKRIGAVSPVSGVHILPNRPLCSEALGWLAQQVKQAEGEAIVMATEDVIGLCDDDLVAAFNSARSADYEAMLTELETLERKLSDLAPEARVDSRDGLARSQRQFEQLREIDYFGCAARAEVESALQRCLLLISPRRQVERSPVAADIAKWVGQRWVTRPRPHVDRLGSIWLIRRFVDAAAKIRYGHAASEDEIPFDMPGTALGHQGDQCTFETMLQSLGLDDRVLTRVAQIIHQIDIPDELYDRPEAAGVSAILSGWLALDLDDQELETRGLHLFDGLYRSLANKA